MNEISNALPFTYDFLENSTFTAREFRDFLANVLREMRTKKITAAGIASDARR
jgi:hypothetical protein